MTDVHMMGLCAPTETDPFGAPLLRALAEPGCEGVQLDVCPVPADLPPHSDRAPAEPPPAVQALRHAVERAHALVLAVPEHPDVPPGPLLTALQWLARPTLGSAHALGDAHALGSPHALDPLDGGSPLAGKPIAVLTTAGGDAGVPEPFTGAEQILLAADSTFVGPRSIVPYAAKILHDQGGPDGRVFISDPSVTIRLLLHIHRLETAARSVSSLGPSQRPPWV